MRDPSNTKGEQIAFLSLPWQRASASSLRASCFQGPLHNPGPSACPSFTATTTYAERLQCQELPLIVHIERGSHEPLLDLPTPVCIPVAHLWPRIAHAPKRRVLFCSRSINTTRVQDTFASSRLRHCHSPTFAYWREPLAKRVSGYWYVLSHVLRRHRAHSYPQTPRDWHPEDGSFGIPVQFPMTHGAPLHVNSFETKLRLFPHTIQKDLTNGVEFGSITLATEDPPIDTAVRHTARSVTPAS